MAMPHDGVELTSLESVFALQNIIHHLIALTPVGAIDQVCDTNKSG
jgi:hypothetical protein